MTTMRELQEHVTRLVTPAAVRRYDAIMSNVADVQAAFGRLGLERLMGAQFRTSTGRARVSP